MTTTESFDSKVTNCPFAPDASECPALVDGLELARESSGEVFIGGDTHESDSSHKRVVMLMEGAVKYVRNNPCEGCPNRTIPEA